MSVDPAIEDVYLRLIEQIAALPPEQLTMASELAACGFDSLAVVMSIAIAEDIAGSVMPEDLITSIRTPADIWAFVTSHADPTSIGAGLGRAARDVHALKD